MRVARKEMENAQPDTISQTQINTVDSTEFMQQIAASIVGRMEDSEDLLGILNWRSSPLLLTTK